MFLGLLAFGLNLYLPPFEPYSLRSGIFFHL